MNYLSQSLYSFNKSLKSFSGHLVTKCNIAIGMFVLKAGYTNFPYNTNFGDLKLIALWYVLMG